MDSELPALLRACRDQLEALPGAAASDAGRRARDRLERDLLPRCAVGSPYLVIGIVGPNNAGKSTLFNALAGSGLSPALPTGGATRRLVGAAHPELIGRLRAEPTLHRFPIHALDPNEAERALDTGADSSELLLASTERLPASLLLIDTPDFDSIHERNRLASESLLAVADLAVALVTRHSYQNREVVRYLERWLAHGRPWILVYNEASDDDVVAEHAAKLADDVGAAPLAVYAAAHDLEVQAGKRLRARRLRDAPHDSELTLRGAELGADLADLQELAQLKRRALASSLAQLRDDLRELARDRDTERERAARLLEAADEHGSGIARAVAASAMPVGPFLEAFHVVLDRRSNPLSRRWRGGLRRARLQLERLPGLLRRRKRTGEDEQGGDLGRKEAEELEREWPAFWEDLVRDLGREARHPARRDALPQQAELLDQDLDPARGGAARRAFLEAIQAEPRATDAFQAECETLVEAAIEARGYDWDVQAAADLAPLAPLALSTAIVIKTGGLGADLAVAGGGAAGTFFTERLSRLLGSSILEAARGRWTTLRSERLTRMLRDSCLERSAPELDARVAAADREAQALRRLAARLAESNPAMESA